MGSGNFLTTNFFSLGAGYFLSKPLLFLFMIGYIVVYIGVTLVLFYHWSSYGMKSKGVVIAKNIFISTSLFLFICLLISLYLY